MIGIQYAYRVCSDTSMGCLEMQKPKPEPKAKPFSIRLVPTVREALDKAGRAEDRPAAYVALRYIVEGLKAGGFLK